MSETSNSILILFNRVKNGDANAWIELFVRLDDEIRNCISPELRGNQHLVRATSIVHDILLKGYLPPDEDNPDAARLKKLDFKKIEGFYAFVVMCAHRSLIDRARKNNRDPMKGRTPAVPSPAPTPGRITLEEVFKKLEALRNADPTLFAVASLMLAGKSAKEVAELLDMPLKTVYAKWKFAQAWLRRQFEE